MKKVLIVRTDRLGDVLLTTPVGTALKRGVPGCRVYWLVRPYAAPLLQHNPDVDGVLLDEGAAGLSDRVRSEQFDAAILALPRWRPTWAVWRAGIPLRIGPASKWYTALLNRRAWQHRSAGARHEADYNLELLQPLGVSFQRERTVYVATKAECQNARRLLESFRVSFRRPIVVLHPGSGGSSDRWPLSHFIALGDRLMQAGMEVVVTAGAGETYQSFMIDQMKSAPIFIPSGSVSVRELAAIFSHAHVVASNSTGPLHLAVALDRPTVSIYSPLSTCHPRRWGPYPFYVDNAADRHRVFVAPMRGTRVAMEAVGVEDVAEACRRLASAEFRPEAARL